MAELPMRAYWLGRDVETLPRETLLEIIHHLSGELTKAREHARRDIDMIACMARRL